MRTEIIGFSILLMLASCGRLPSKPEVENCIIITELGIASCFNNQTSNEYDLPLEDMNKYTCFSPEDWNEILTYTRLLERARSKNTRREAKKFRRASELNFNGISDN